jgi:drug/metabolite transporter (DMT)-like permease
LSIVGVLVVVAGGLGTGTLGGDAVALLMTLGNALYIVLIRKFRDSPVVLAGGISAFQLFCVSWLFADPLTVSQSDAVLLALFGISFAVAVVLWTEGTRLIQAAEAALLGSAETPFAILLAWLLLAELPPPTSFIGGGIVLATVLTHAALGLEPSERNAPRVGPAEPKRPRSRIATGGCESGEYWRE